MRRAFALVCSLVLAGCAVELSPRGDGGRGDADAELACGAQSLCHGRCVDLSSDPEHCGGCDRTCVVPGARAACVAGACAIAGCELGRADCNGTVDDGCEREIDCAPGGACTTACGSTGALACDDACAPVCAPPAESCNLADDDCDGACETDLPGCRRGVHRSNGPSGHFYTIDAGEAACCGMTVEALDFYFVYAGALDHLQPFFRCITASGHHFYTTDTACDMLGGYESTIGFVARDARCGATPLHRLRHASGDHFYTHSDAERDSAISIGYTYVGIAAYVWRSR